MPDPQGPPEGDDPVWSGAQRVEEWAGEVRVNLIRLVAITAFYANHLITYYALRELPDAAYHQAVTGITLAWASAALALHLALSRRWNPAGLKYAAVAWDAFMVTTLLLVSDGTTSPLLILYFLVIASASLRLHLRLVWAATLCSIAGYAILCGQARWTKPEWRVPRRQQIMFAIGLTCAGLLAGQAVRQSKRLARDYADRVRPERDPIGAPGAGAAAIPSSGTASPGAPA